MKKPKKPNKKEKKKEKAFDQSLMSFSAVVKGCVLKIFGPNVEAAVWGSLVQPR